MWGGEWGSVVIGRPVGLWQVSLSGSAAGGWEDAVGWWAGLLSGNAPLCRVPYTESHGQRHGQ